MQEVDKAQVRITTNDLILIQLRDLKENVRDLRQEVRDTRNEINQRMEKLEEKMRDTRNEVNQRMDRLEEKMERLTNRQDSSSTNGNIMTASVVGIALTVLYFVATH